MLLMRDKPQRKEGESLKAKGQKKTHHVNSDQKKKLVGFRAKRASLD